MDDRQKRPKRFDELMREFGFRPDAAASTGRALIINLVRSAYGPEMARDFIRHMNLVENSEDKSSKKESEFQKSPCEPEQLSFFSGTGTD
jgi:hypothetical protein